MDGQHRALLHRMQEAVAAATADDLAAAKRALRALSDYLVAHFAAEQALMAESLYPERERHRAAHELFMQEFVQLARDLELAGLSVPTLEGIASRLPEWIKFHIRANDVPLGRYLASRRSPLATSARPDSRRAR